MYFYNPTIPTEETAILNLSISHITSCCRLIMYCCTVVIHEPILYTTPERYTVHLRFVLFSAWALKTERRRRHSSFDVNVPRPRRHQPIVVSTPRKQQKYRRCQASRPMTTRKYILPHDICTVSDADGRTHVPSPLLLAALHVLVVQHELGLLLAALHVLVVQHEFGHDAEADPTGLRERQDSRSKDRWRYRRRRPRQ